MSKCSKKNVRIPKCAHSALKTEKKIEEDEILSDIDNQTIEIVTKIESDQSNDNDGQSFPITEIILNTEIDTYDLKPEVSVEHFKLSSNILNNIVMQIIFRLNSMIQKSSKKEKFHHLMLF